MCRADRIRIKYAPDTLQVLKDPNNELVDLFIVCNPEGMGPGLKALVVNFEDIPEVKELFLEFLN